MAAWAPPVPDGCTVKVNPGNYSFTGRCFRDEVVTEVSLDPLRVRCGRVDVTCTKRPQKSGSEREAGEAVEESVDSDRHS